MKTMKWLLRREFWEHKGMMFWAPIVVASLMLLFVSASTLWAATSGNWQNKYTHTTIDGKTTTTVSSAGSAFNDLPAEKVQQAGEMVANGYLMAAAPLFLMLAVVVFFYCLGCLSDERRDRSILFWKSLPVSDTETVLSKVVTAALVAPLITIAVGTFVSLLLLLVVGTGLASTGVNMFGPVLSNSAFYMAPLQLLGLLPVYVLWALPTIGWLMMVSAWAKSKVFLWAVGTPLLTVAIVKWADVLLHLGIDMQWFLHDVISRGLLGLIPGIWLPMTKVDADLLVNHNTAVIGNVFTQSWMTLATPNVWIGAAAGAAMIFAAIRLRRWKDEG
ncbi:MAG: hypothetical protein V4631_20720 [Pseudomonadota bacterium]